ncbi:MAG: sensor histidine kinase, partial [Alcanivorax sp.]
NLIDNACRYSARGSKIVVSGYRSGNQIVFLIIDGGPGLTPDEQLKFSGRFSRGRHDVAGAGLGLSIVERILALAGGSLSYRLATQELPAAAELRLPAA